MIHNNLKLAIDMLAEIHEGKTITAIRIDDGNPVKFGYQLDDSPIWQQRDLSKAFKASRANDTYFTTQSRAISYAMDSAFIKGYGIEDNEPAFNQPIEHGQTKQFHIDLYKNDKLLTKQLHIILYRMDSGKYELTHYIN